MTTRAQELLDASMELTLRPQKDDRKKLIAFIINEAAAPSFLQQALVGATAVAGATCATSMAGVLLAVSAAVWA